MFHKTVCKNSTLLLTEKDKKEAYNIIKEMIKPDAPKKYAHYQKYEESLESFINQIHEITHIQHYKTTETTVPPFIEDDKTLLLKEKSMSIIELFSKVKKI
jgi:hypothetical protein